MKAQNKYNQHLDIKYNHLELIDVPAIIAENKEKWFNQTLTKINDSVARIGIVHRPWSLEKTVMLMVETSAIDPLGD